MSMTLLQICTDALEAVGGLNVPTTIFNNDDDTAIILKRAAVQTGRELVRSFTWQALLTPTTFLTVSGTSQYSKEADFQRFANRTFYNVTQFRELYGPLTPPSWAEITRGINISTFNYNFRTATGFIELSPTPTSAETIGYDYYSSYYSTDSGGTAQANWTADTDLSRLPDDLFTLGIRYRFLQRKSLPFTEDKADYLQAITDALFDDTPKGLQDITGLPTQVSSNIPESNFG